jgi:hypothetical protein
VAVSENMNKDKIRTYPRVEEGAKKNPYLIISTYDLSQKKAS